MSFIYWADQVGHSVANSSPSLRHFFERNCLAFRRNDAKLGPANLLNALVWYSEYNERFDLDFNDYAKFQNILPPFWARELAILFYWIFPEEAYILNPLLVENYICRKLVYNKIIFQPQRCARLILPLHLTPILQLFDNTSHVMIWSSLSSRIVLKLIFRRCLNSFKAIQYAGIFSFSHMSQAFWFV